MKGLSHLSTGAIASCVLALGLLAQDVLASPQPKSSWVRNGRGRKAMADMINGKAKAKRLNMPRTTCPEVAATEVTAPKTNVWGGLTDVEAASVASWLFAQSDLNLTVSENATEWDNTV
jgi:primary-amine oxidase